MTVNLLMRFYSYLNSAIQILDEYKGDIPFAVFLKKYFSRFAKYGSKDRRQISHLCYCFFRLGKSAPPFPTQRGGFEERMLIGLFLCSAEPNEILEQLKPEWNKQINLATERKLLIINYSLLIENVFPWKEELSDGIDHEKFCESFFKQPDLFLRLRPKYEIVVKEKLSNAELSFKEINSSCLALPNNSKVESIIELDREAVVQDYNSQRVGEFFQSAILNLKSKVFVWDCCAGSGGKSLLLHDIYRNVDLTVSDIRESILANLKKRFAKAGIKKYKSFVTDLTSNQRLRPIESSGRLIAGDYDLIICDAPCTGSGTWSRTPEQLYFFDENLPAGQAGKIDQYSLLQKRIVSNIVPYLKENGFLVYITCSVFKKENEEVANYLREEFNLELTNMELLKGYDKKADTMFVSLFKRNL
jgi:16S rRNA (cytosine967-C5)-methyltransferase